MKNIIVFYLLCFVLNFPLYAQNACTNEEVGVSISKVVWNATTADLTPILGEPFDGKISTKNFHIAYLDFVFSTDFQQNGDKFSFDLSVIRSNKPVVLLFESEIFPNTENATGSFVINPILDTDMLITGFQVTRSSFGTDGVATSAGLMLRESQFGSLCIDISLENQLNTELDGTTCQLPDEVVRKCRKITLNPINILSQVGRRKAQSSNNDVNIYPIPAQDNVFINVQDLEINSIQIIDIQGKIQHHKSSIKYETDCIQINTAQLKNGIYWLSIETSDKLIFRKIVIQR